MKMHASVLNSLRLVALLAILAGVPISAAFAEVLLIGDNSNGVIRRYDSSTGAYLGIFASGGGLTYASGMAYGPDGNLYVGDFYSKSILRYGGRTGAFLGVFATAPDQVFDVTFGPDGNLYVGLSGTVVRYNGTTGAPMGQFTAPKYVCGGMTFHDGSFFVSYLGNTSGELLQYTATTGALIGTLYHDFSANGPRGPRFGPDGNLYVPDWQTPHIAKFDGTTLAYQGNIVNDGTHYYPMALWFNSQGQLYVLEDNLEGSGGSVAIYDLATGAFQRQLFAPGAGGLGRASAMISMPPPPPPTVYVATNGVDAGLSCTNSATPCATIRYALGQAMSGGTTRLSAGVYTESGLVLEKNLTLIGAGATNTVIQAATTPNSATNRVFLIQSNAVVTIQDVTVRHGSSPGGDPYTYTPTTPGGGGILNSGALTLSGVEVTINRTADGQSQSWTTTPGGPGGGIYNEGTLTLSNSTVAGNSTGVGGSAAGGPNPWGSPLPSSGGPGGGIFNTGYCIVENSTVSDNVTGKNGDDWIRGFPADSYGPGGGIYNSGSLAISNSTITANAGAQGGGICSTGLVAARLTILGGNTDDDAQPAGQDLTGGIVSGGFNLIQDTNGWALSGSTNGNIVGLNPILAPLAYNGGPTRTHALVTGSPAIDGGDPAFTPPPFTDQRGQPRVQGLRVDIGAYEGEEPGPVIYAPPQNQVVAAGSSAAFNVGASGAAPMSYQWRFQGQNLSDGPRVSGATGSNLVILAVQPADAGAYTVGVSNFAGLRTSAPPATLTLALPPAIAAQPNDQFVPVGAAASFSVAASGTPPLWYQWQADGPPLPQATNTTLQIANAQTNQARQYAVVITNIAGAVTSRVALLTVFVPPQVRWQTEIVPASPRPADPALGTNGILYVGTADGRLLALAGTNGAQLWESAYGPLSTFTENTMIGPDSSVYVLDGRRYCSAVDGGTGALRWQRTNALLSGPMSLGADGTLYAADGGSPLAMDPATGSTRWGLTNLGFSAAAIGANGTVYFDSPGLGALGAFDPETGAQLWRALLPFNDEVALAIGAEGTVYAARGPAGLYALDGATGVRRWATTNQLASTASPALGTNGTIFIGSARNTVLALDGLTGQLRWESPPLPGLASDTPATDRNGTVYVGVSWTEYAAGPMWGTYVVVQKERLYALDGASGSLLWFAEGGGSPLIGQDGTLYTVRFEVTSVFSGSGDYLGASAQCFLYAIETGSRGLASSSWPMLGQNPQHSGRAPQAPAFASTAVTPEGKLAFTVTSEPNRVFALESSTNLLTWTPLRTITNTMGTVTVQEAVTGGQRFFRAALLPANP
jgi:outer membrane protein assembly factor BamB